MKVGTWPHLMQRVSPGPTSTDAPSTVNVVTPAQRETVAEPFDISASTEEVIVIGPRSIGSKDFAAIRDAPLTVGKVF
jgi:hypothetical protein